MHGYVKIARLPSLFHTFYNVINYHGRTWYLFLLMSIKIKSINAYYFTRRKKNCIESTLIEINITINDTFNVGTQKNA